jgi:ribosomal protein L29
MELRKLTFQEAWDSSTIFFVDEELENEIDEKVAELLRLSQSSHLSGSPQRTSDDIVAFLKEDPDGLDVILCDIGLSDEKFMRIISILRKIGRISGGFDSEWSIAKIKRQLADEPLFLRLVAQLLLDGVRDQGLSVYVPRYCLDRLNYREIGTITLPLRKIRYKEFVAHTYDVKSQKFDLRMREVLEKLKEKHKVGYESGYSRVAKMITNFSIPSLEDPWVVILSSFQEIDHPYLTFKFEYMLNAYNELILSNSRFRENRVLVNFVDGGGWLARRQDLRVLVEQCHYFINLQNLDMLEAIVLAHVPKSYFSR